VQIKLKDRTETYTGAVEIDFQPNENVTVRLTDGRIADLFADGTWQVWTPPVHATGVGTDTPAQLIGQGEFHALPTVADPAPAA
jgi:hypothetical protein